MNDFRKFKSILGTICKKKKRVFRKKKFKKGRGAWLVIWGGVFSILIYNVPKKLTNQKHLKPMFSILIYPFHVNPYFKWLELEVIYLRVGNPMLPNPPPMNKKNVNPYFNLGRNPCFI